MQLEVLLLTDTTFTSQNLCKKDESGRGDHLSEKQQLAEACLNGLLQTILPDTFLKTAMGGILYLWQIKEAVSFLELELGEVPRTIDSQFSITPHLFLSTQNLN